METIQPTHNEKLEWARMAQKAYSTGRNSTGHRYAGFAALPEGSTLPVNVFDTLQHDYRAWLIDDVYPE